MNNIEKLESLKRYRDVLNALYDKRYTIYDKNNRKHVKYFKKCKEIACLKVYGI